MAAEWEIQHTEHTLDGNGDPEFITVVHWKAKDVNGDFDSTACGTVGFNDDHPSRNVPYANITEIQCIAWVKADLGGEEVSGIESAMLSIRNEKETPTKGTGNPW